MPVYIRDDDHELLELVRTFGKPVFPVGEIFSKGGFGRTKGYELLNSGELPSFFVGSRRYVLALDYGRFLLRLKRAGNTENNEADQRSASARERRLKTMEKSGAEAA
jgi:hypothetical protein